MSKFDITSFKEQEKGFNGAFKRVATPFKVPGASKVETLVHQYVHFYNADPKDNTPNYDPYFSGILCHMKDGSYVIVLRADIFVEATFKNVDGFVTFDECKDVFFMQMNNREVALEFLDSDQCTGYIVFRFEKWEDVVHHFYNTQEMYELDSASEYSTFYGKDCDAEAVPIEDATSILGDDAKPFEKAMDKAYKSYKEEAEKAEAA